MRANRGGLDAQLARVVNGIHAAAINDVPWALALENICGFLGAQAADMNFFDPRLQQVVRFQPVFFDESLLKRYSQYVPEIVKVNPRMPTLFQKSEGDCWADSEIWHPRVRNRIGFFAEVTAPGGIHEALTAWVRKSDDGRPWITLLVHYCSKAEVSAEARRRLHLVLPYLKQALASEERLAAALRQKAILDEALDCIADAVALVDETGRVLRANPAAQRCFLGTPGLSLGADDRIVLADPAARSGLSTALARCAAPQLILLQPGAASPLQVRVRRAEGGPLLLTLQPLNRDYRAPGGAIAVLFMTEPSAKPADRLASLRCAYNLSPMEARLVQALTDGKSLREFAEERQMSYETARSHIRRIQSKTGARGQLDLVRMALSLR